MKRKKFFGILNLVCGCVTVPYLISGFLYATNTLKGVDVYNPDGEIFIPLGIIMLLIVVAFVVNQIIMIIRRKKSKSAERFLFKYSNNFLYIVGILLSVLMLLLFPVIYSSIFRYVVGLVTILYFGLLNTRVY